MAKRDKRACCHLSRPKNGRFCILVTGLGLNHWRRSFPLLWITIR